MTRWLLACLIWVMLALTPVAARAEDKHFETRAAELPVLLRTEVTAEDFFAPSFLAAVPIETVNAILRQLIETNGAVTGLARFTLTAPGTGVVEINYERSTATFDMTIDPAPPHKVIGLRLSSVRRRDPDTPETFAADIAKLPGQAGLLIRRLDKVEPPRLNIRAEDIFAIGSAFKLWVLAEATRAVGAGERQWRDVIPLGPPALPSGITQDWPKGAPMTLHSLATLMISISDNTATDTLITALGRRRVDAAVRLTGHHDPARTLPLLSTVEAFALKMVSTDDLRSALARANTQSKITLLNRNRTRLTRAAINLSELAVGPRYIDQIEWFASPADMARTLDWLRRKGGAEARAIMAISPGLLTGDAARFTSVGYKGGSEAGVLSANYLIQTKSGAWYALTASWNNPQALVSEPQFRALIARALAFIP
jgi:beta-lactamase class A